MNLFNKLAGKIVDNAARGVGSAVGNAVRNTAERKAGQVVQNQVDKAADALIKTGGTPGAEGAGSGVDASELNSAVAKAGGLSGIAGIMQNYANDAAKNMKICPQCEQPAAADKKFCPSCGAALPDQTLAEASACPQCGKQNDIGTKFCSGCGAKLPYAEMEEEAERRREAAAAAEAMENQDD